MVDVWKLAEHVLLDHGIEDSPEPMNFIRWLSWLEEQHEQLHDENAYA